MSILVRAAVMLSEQITSLTGGKVSIDPVDVFDRTADLELNVPGRISANGHCRMVRALDGWLAVNLPRQDDVDMVPAWIGSEVGSDAWHAVTLAASRRNCAELLEQAILLGLAVSKLGETSAVSPHPQRLFKNAAASAVEIASATVLDLSTLWAGPLCGSILAAAGAEVTKLESGKRPDPVRVSSPILDERLNGLKRRRQLDFTDVRDVARLREMALDADVIITSARPRAFRSLGLDPESMIDAKPSLIWIAVTAHGWNMYDGMRVGFGDDAAVAGGLVRWADGCPSFIGDAPADPLTGLAAGASCLEMLNGAQGGLIDAALALTAAGVVKAHG